MLPEQREPDFQIDDYKQTDMWSRKWIWFLSSSETYSEDHEEHREMDYLELCHQKEGPGAETIGKGVLCG